MLEINFFFLLLSEGIYLPFRRKKANPSILCKGQRPQIIDQRSHDAATNRLFYFMRVTLMIFFVFSDDYNC